MTYLWIGIGGALGSVARAWLAVMVARLTGPQFPWGTILINIVGSFIIGFFGTLTANDGRFAVPADLRAFVMVGICGGFTTFSSFSLQTLELLRDGRVGQAAGNVGLSVVLCLLAVTAGYASASGIHSARRSAASAPGKQVVVVLSRPDGAHALLDAGARMLALAPDEGSALTALIIRASPAALLPSEEIMTEDRAADLRAGQDDVAANLRATAQAWLLSAEQRGVDAKLVEVEGDPAEIISEHAAGVVLTVVGRPARGDGEHIARAMHAALFATDCPTLVVPPSASRSFGKIVAIAWKDDARAQEAVRASLPLLRRAEAVHILSTETLGELPPLLQDNGIHANWHLVLDDGGSVGQRLLDATHQLGADMLVVGAFAHGAWRETVFGGVTRTLLASAEIPLFMRH